MAGACAPIFLHGVVKQNNNNDVVKAGLNKWRTVTLNRVPKDANNEQTLAAAMQPLSVRVSGYSKLGADKALVEFALDNRTFDKELEAHDKGTKQGGAAPIVFDMCFGVKMLYQLYVSSKHKVVLPNPNFRPGSTAAPELTVGGVAMDRLVSWQLGTSGVQVQPYWRSPVSTVSDFSGVSHRFGVALSLMGTEDDMKVRALGITVLPEGPFSKVLQIVFTPPAQPISLLCNEDNTAFYSIQIGTSMVAFEPSVFSIQDMAFINKVRRTVSHAIAGTLESSSPGGASSGAARGGAGRGGGGRRQGDSSGGGRGPQGSLQSTQAMLSELMSLLMRPDLTQEEKDEQRAFEGGGVHGMKPGMPAPSRKPKLHWVRCRFEENSVDYLPQVYLDPSPAVEHSAGGGGAGAGAARKGAGGQAAPAEIPAGYVGISLLCSHDFNVASQMPAGMYMTSREECESGRHAWYEICCREFSPKPNQFKDQVCGRPYTHTHARTHADTHTHIHTIDTHTGIPSPVNRHTRATPYTFRHR